MLQVTGTVAFDTIFTVPHLPAADQTARVRELSVLPGGAAGNVALALGRLRERPRLVAAVGPDFTGSDYEARLAQAGVDLSGVARLDVATAHAIIASADDGPQHVYFFPGAAHALPVDPPAGAPEVGHFTAGPIDRYESLMRACRVVTFDPGQECFHRDTAEIVRVLPLVDVLFVNQHELKCLQDATGWSLARLMDEGPDTVIVTLGADGQRVHQRGEPDAHVPAVPVRVVEPTGAGDAHRAGYLYALARGADAVTAAKLGAVMASFALSALGTQDGLPTLADARARYEKAFGPWPFPDA